MKKLMMAVAVCCAAVAVQAATVKWDSATMYTVASADGGNSTTKISGTAFTATLYTLTEAQYNTYLASYTADGNMKAVYDAFNGADGGTAMTLGRGGNFTASTTAAVGDTVYAAVVFTTTATFEGTASDFYIANIASGYVGSDAGITVGNLSTVFLGEGAATGTATGGWTAVPEPTSGLLMLLGMAGLALRRKRA